MTPTPEVKGVLTGAEDVVNRYGLERTRMTLDAGILGKIFGSAANAPTNIAGFILCLLSLTAVALIVFRSNEPVADNLTLLVPIITLTLGYLFGRQL